METWWTYRWNPVTRQASVIRWSQRGNLAPTVEHRFDELTWQEAVDVLDADSTAILRRALRG